MGLENGRDFHETRQIFQKASPTRAFEDIVKQIEDAIISGELKAHDRIPSERELQHIFGVGRASVREAIRVLESAGMVEVRTGAVSGGIFVKPLTTAMTVEALQRLFLLEKISERELVEFRQAVEGITGYWAAKRATNEDIKRIQDIVDKTEPGDIKWDEFHAADVEFHLAVADAAKNRINLIVMQAVRQTMIRVMRITFKNLMSRRKARDAIIEEHQVILETIKNRNAEKARELMFSHITNFYKGILDESSIVK
ncbi:FadR/GntR family transcriptional regulator [Desulfotomaculum copahuensis]|uniref:HTH gntR-type domain-containing protein n=1 Tax=Desulfotomaculum copahuensis TaxID=1838280 RepID=A0A1B7LIE2_9FIRM|nr:FadR/GntR family transcriptional regulator [Desulfotomaculum copahuensis]OAT86337.1 hypothetical protein A6M21_03835 [Desulfotomaculum copahuensis]